MPLKRLVYAGCLHLQRVRTSTLNSQRVRAPYLNDLFHNLWVNVTHTSTRGQAITPVQQQLCRLRRQLLLLLLLLRLRVQLLLCGLEVVA
jgi:hypothetical protein